jgi:sarcosine oxidase subunit gamma
MTALGGHAPQVDSHGGVTCREVPEVALASYAARLGSEAAAGDVLRARLGGDVPPVGKSAFGTLTALWTGPDQWLIEAPFDSHEDIAQTLAAAAMGLASVTEQTDAWTRFDLTGDGVLAVLELLCAADTRAMQTGDVVRSAIHHLGCFIHRRGADHFAIYGPRASAGSLHHAMITAMHAAL